jgi:hypothetical protein
VKSKKGQTLIGFALFYFIKPETVTPSYPAPSPKAHDKLKTVPVLDPKKHHLGRHPFL